MVLNTVTSVSMLTVKQLFIATHFISHMDSYREYKLIEGRNLAVKKPTVAIFLPRFFIIYTVPFIQVLAIIMATQD